MTDIIDRLSDHEFSIDLVHRFFDGKYTEQEVNSLLYDLVGDKTQHVRKGVHLLSEEWNNHISKFYEATDYYIFDLIPWNGCGMYKPHVEKVINIITKLHDSTQPYSVLDFGGGVGTLCIALSQNIPELDIFYVDLGKSVTYKFAKFFMNEINVHIKMMDVQEFFDSELCVNFIAALDCFEHLPNLERVLDKLTQRTTHIYHNSTFVSSAVQPQHIETRGLSWFLNAMAERNFAPNPANEGDNINWMSKFIIQYKQKGDSLLTATMEFK